MTRSPEVERAEELFRTVFPPRPEETTARFRERYDRMLDGFPIDDALPPAELDLGDVRTVAVGSADGPVVVWLHGGGYVIGSPEAYLRHAQAIARAIDGLVILPDYRLAPEHRHPAAVDDAEAVVRAAIERWGAARVVVAGDSAGGALALASLLRLRATGARLPAAAVLYSPLADLTGTASSLQRVTDDPAVDARSIAMVRRFYLGDVAPDHPEVSPALTDLSGLPPTLVVVGGHEALLDDAVTTTRALAVGGGAVRLEVAPDMCHVYPLFAAFLPEAQRALELTGTFVREHTAPAS
ncbi:alpha/beta hydrolase fold domain-containing protein [Microbacterium gorillae]|uniref:alpha/beta hydrolase fold domain-containing protein n=1 Tax=Microbacterium gorillae TaxID=1231063 RepID=UPI0005904044|nr:alpha/beta hydrolase fold domain-containing protein [Microbacterium gorillae]